MGRDEGWPGGDSEETHVLPLPPEERRVLATLAVVGRASLSEDELAELVELADVSPLVADLERRGLVRTDERRRSTALGRLSEDIRRTDEALATGERVLGYFSTLARSGRLTPERLAEDSEAILGLSEWAAEAARWQRLLELVQTLQSSYELAQRIEEWIELLRRGRQAVRALGDRQAEIWVLDRLAAASAAVGDSAAAAEYRREADELRRREAGTTTTRSARTSTWRVAAWVAGAFLLGALGVGVGYAIGNAGSGGTVTSGTVTRTVTTSTTATETTTATATETTTTTVPTTTTVETTVTVTVTPTSTVIP